MMHTYISKTNLKKMLHKTLVAYLLHVCFQIVVSQIFAENLEDVSENGTYTIKSYNVETEDGYILQLHRISSLNISLNVNKFYPVLCMHGLLVSSLSWIVIEPKQTLVRYLVNLGYDVWLGNARGNTYSRKHAKLDPDNNTEFWDFSFHEIGYYDLPATIDYILKETGENKINYIGHSQGTTVFFVMGSERPEYNEKINLMIALAPAVFVSNIANPVANLLRHDNIRNLFGLVVEIFNFHEILPWSFVTSSIIKALCNDTTYYDLCIFGMNLIAGKSAIRRTSFLVTLTYFPSGCSYKQIDHYLQGINSGNFAKYDNGNSENAYNLSKVTAPVALFYSKKDTFVDLKNVGKLRAELPNVVFDYLVPDEDFSHLDFIWSSNVKQLNDIILDFIKNYNKTFRNKFLF